MISVHVYFSDGSFDILPAITLFHRDDIPVMLFSLATFHIEFQFRKQQQ